MSSKEKYFSCCAIPHYLHQRTLSQNKLEKLSNLGRNTLNGICQHNQNTMTYDKIKKVAEALHVDIEDLGAPEEERVDILKISSDIHKALESFPVILRQIKAKRIAAYLSLENPDEAFDNALNYLLNDSNWMGRAFACFLLSHDDPEGSDLEHPVFSNLVERIEAYRNQPKYQKKRKTKLITKFPEECGISYYIFTKLLRGEHIKDEEKKLDELLASAARILNIEYRELVSPSRPVVDIKEITDELDKSIAACKPKPLKKRYEILAKSNYLKEGDIYTEYLLGCLLFYSEQKSEVLEILQDAAGVPFFNGEYKPDIKLYYCQDEEGCCEAAVLFENWIYRIFQLESDRPEKHIPIPGSPSEFLTIMNFPVSLEDLSPEDGDFETELREQVLQSLTENEAQSIVTDDMENNPLLPFGLASIFEEYLERYFQYADIVRYDAF